MIVLKALAKQLFGTRYERIGTSLAACVIIFVALHTAEIKVVIAPSILFLTATAFSAGIMWQALNSSQNAETMTGLFMLPFAKRGMTFSLVLAFTGYTLITKTLLVLALFWAIHEWSAEHIALSLLCACNGCFMATAWYVFFKKKLLPLAALWCGVVLAAIFQAGQITTFTLIVSGSLLLSLLYLLTADAYVFYCPTAAKLVIRHTRGTGSVCVYLLRYLVTNKNYLLNTVGLCVIAGVLPLMFGQFEGLNVMPLGFAILCLNTPLCVLLSCDPGLEQAVRVLPGQAGRFCPRYCLFVFFINTMVNSVYLICWQIQHGGIGGIEILTALLFALQGAILSVLLEWLYPLRNWKVENDLLHHPRKYIVPLIMLLIAGLIGMWPASMWILLCVVLAESFTLPLIARRI